VGLRTFVGRNVVIRDSVLLGHDFYEQRVDGDSTVPMGIGAGTVIERAIVDKNCRIGSGVKVINERKLETRPEAAQCTIIDGIVVVERAATLPNGWSLE